MRSSQRSSKLRTNRLTVSALGQSEQAAEKRRVEQEKAAMQSELQCAQQRLVLEKTHLASLQISDALAEQVRHKT